MKKGDLKGLTVVDLNLPVEYGSSTVDAVICVWVMSMLSLLCPRWDAWLVLAVSWSRQSGRPFGCFRRAKARVAKLNALNPELCPRALDLISSVNKFGSVEGVSTQLYTTPVCTGTDSVTLILGSRPTWKTSHVTVDRRETGVFYQLCQQFG